MVTSFKNVRFIASATDLSHAPPDRGREVAFVGRSNSGKSSAINAITRNAKLARVSKTPGRTQQLIFFEIDEHQRLVDLPGYGFAKVPPEMREQWQRLIESYLEQRESLRGLVLIVDSRRGIVDLDQVLIEWCARADVPVHILLSKCDKLTRNEGTQILRAVREDLARRGFAVGVQLFSAMKGDGVAEAQGAVSRWLQGAKAREQKNAPAAQGGSGRG